GVYSTHHRFTKRVRASEDFNPECVVELSSSPFSIRKQGQTTDSILGARSEFGAGNFKEGAQYGFKDKLMGKVNLVKNVGIDVGCLSDTHEDLNDDEDVVISRGEKGPSIQFSDRAMERLS
ncbi:unnamed protein product, partial [Prunus brigantina]